MLPLSNVETRGGEPVPPCAGLAPDVFPEATSSQTGVSVGYVPDEEKNWYVFRASYGRADSASDFLIEAGTYVYVAKRYERKTVNGQAQRKLVPLIPNLLFVYATLPEAKHFVKDTPALHYLSFYLDHFSIDAEGKNPPLVIPDNQMANFIKATWSHNEHLKFVNESQCHFKGGEIVRVVEGPFVGVEGRVARVAGQQCVVISITSLGLVSTAYVPTAFIEEVRD